MTVCAGVTSLLDRLRSRVSALINDKRGVAAVEFALIVPLLLSLYFVTMEVSQSIETSKKVSRIGSMVADLITQQQRVTQEELIAIMTIGESILQPYSRSDPKITVTAIEINDEQEACTKWSLQLGDAPSLATTVPEDLMTPGFLIRVESFLPYQPVITWSPDQQTATGLGAMGKIFANGILNMNETYYLRPRMSSTIHCDDCVTPPAGC